MFIKYEQKSNYILIKLNKKKRKLENFSQNEIFNRFGLFGRLCGCLYVRVKRRGEDTFK